MIEGLALVTHFITWFPVFSQAPISPSVPAVCSKAGPSTAPIGCIMQLFLPEIQTHMSIQLSLVSLATSQQLLISLEIAILLSSEICQCAVPYLGKSCTQGGRIHWGAWKCCFGLLLRFNLTHSERPSCSNKRMGYMQPGTGNDTEHRQAEGWQVSA